MNNMTIFSSKDGKWWSVHTKATALNYSYLLEHLKFDRKKIKKLKIKLRKGDGEDIRYESIHFKYKKCWYKIVNSGVREYDLD